MAEIIEYKEELCSNFEGTIIDIETVGEFCREYRDSRHYQDIRLVIFGYINRSTLHILCATGNKVLNELREKTEKIISGLDRPFYAYNTEFERCVLFYELGKEVEFACELQEGRESKANARNQLGIPNYDDPFYDYGYMCLKAWENREFDRAIAHNRACLLKERDILLKRGFRRPNDLILVKQE